MALKANSLLRSFLPQTHLEFPTHVDVRAQRLIGRRREGSAVLSVPCLMVEAWRDEMR